MDSQRCRRPVAVILDTEYKHSYFTHTRWRTRRVGASDKVNFGFNAFGRRSLGTE